MLLAVNGAAIRQRWATSAADTTRRITLSIIVPGAWPTGGGALFLPSAFALTRGQRLQAAGLTGRASPVVTDGSVPPAPMTAMVKTPRRAYPVTSQQASSPPSGP